MVTSQPIKVPKSHKYETARIRLTSPMLRIGGEFSQLNPYEYVQTGNRVYLPNQETLAKALLEKGRPTLDDYIQQVEGIKDITQLLKQAFGEDWYEAKDSLGNPIFPKKGITSKWVDGRITDLRPMIRNGFGEPYIPGSSIKGAIRTAIAFHIFKNAHKYKPPTTISEIEKILRSKLSNNQLRTRNQQKWLDDNLFMSSLFEDFSLKYQDSDLQKKQKSRLNKANTDIFRVIKVSDSLPLLEKTITGRKTGKKRTFNTPITAKTIVSSYDYDDKAKYKAPIYAEMVYRLRTEFTIAIDTEMLSWFHHNQGMKLPFQNINDLINICQEFAQYQWDGEYDYWNEVKNNYDKRNQVDLDFDLIRDFYEEEKCPYHLRLGWGTGMEGMTINSLIRDDDLKAEIRDTCGMEAPGFKAPKSRRTVVDYNEEIRFALGWSKLEIL